MIGVTCRENQVPVVKEFFEAFKTPWAFCSSGGRYDVVVSTDLSAPLPPAKLAIVFSEEAGAMDDRIGIKIRSRSRGGHVAHDGEAVPIYGGLAAFEGSGRKVLVTGDGQVAGLMMDLRGGQLLRIGYDLLEEVNSLLSRGQPVRWAPVPTLEMHIGMMRDWILAAGIPLVEIPPAPCGFDFITCLTHDIDFMGIREHGFDHTMLGFAYRALVPAHLRGMDRRTAFARYGKNLRALLSVPLVHAGLRPDFWDPLAAYPQVEAGLRSTYFFIPFKDRPGTPLNGRRARYRASRYDVARFEKPIRNLQSLGHEVGLHGIDAWRDPDGGRAELNVIRRITGAQKIGVRMHWLYFSESTPKNLDEAGVYYDSTVGYNDAVGFRSGTTQVFRFPGTELFELPLHIQDTAMLFPDRMGVSETRAVDLCNELTAQARTHGGVFTSNWHDRSLAPERNWDGVYLSLLRKLREERTWFATGGEAVAWFEKRRGCRFEEVGYPGDAPEVVVRSTGAGNGPPLVFRRHRPDLASGGGSSFEDACIDFPPMISDSLPVAH